MWKIKLYLIIFLGFVYQLSNAQFGNEWIEEDKSYYKIKVAEDGLYRVTASELASAGVPVSNIATGRYQLFHLGNEVSIQVFDENGDGRLDYFDFYGEKNDGRLDTELYVTPEAQSHTYYSLFTDTASYFLTWHLTSNSGKRMAFSSINDPAGVSATGFHMAEELVLETGNYASGYKYGSGSIPSAVYDVGEGWTTSEISKNQNKTYTFSLENVNTSAKPQLELVLHGMSSFEHVSRISVGTSTSALRVLDDVNFAGRDIASYAGEIEWTDVSASGNLVVRITSIGVTGQVDAIAIAYVKLSYPQRFDLADASKSFVVPNSTNARQYVVVPTTNAQNLRVFDVSDGDHPARVARTTYSDRLEYVYQDTTDVSRDFLITSDVKSVAGISESAIASLDLSGADYLLISNRSLNVTIDGIQPVDAYAAYRRSQAGGAHQVHVAYMDQLYDQFSYGVTSPLAIKNYLSYALASGAPENVFLIGKATSVDKNYHRQVNSSLIHYVPTFGYPGSDALFSVQNGATKYLLPVGRLNAFDAGDVKVYLDKVKEMEAVGYNGLWRKNLVHLSGGQTAGELSTFRNYINNFKALAETDFLGGSVTSLNKNSTDIVKVINVADEVNAGVSLITFFGHSSGIVTDVEIGRASDQNAGYLNKGKYPVILVNGCSAGGIFGDTNPDNPPSSLTFGEDWIRTPDAGAIGFIANSDLALSANLKRYSDLFYSFAFTNTETFGQSIGQIMLNTANRYLDIYGTSAISAAQIYQTVLQGDPVITVFGAKQPDYAFQQNDTYADGFIQERVVANLDSFRLNLVVKNFGRSVTDSLEVRVRRTFADGSQRDYVRVFERVLRHDTLEFTITNEQADAVEGTNNFIISVDYLDQQEELSESNNTGTFDLFIPRGNTIALYPVPYALTSQEQVELVWQSANILEQVRTYSLEIDTTVTFSSPFFRTQEVNGGLLNRYFMDLSSFTDSTTVYWRTRFAEAKTNEDTNWVSSSFTHVKSIDKGWGQVDEGQFHDNQLSGVSFKSGTNELIFNQTFRELQINTHGPASGKQYEDYQVVIDGLNLLLTDNKADPVCKRSDAINAVFFDRETAQPFRPLGTGGTDVLNDLVCGRLPQMIHNLNENNVLGTQRYLDSLIKIIDDRDIVVLFSFGTVNYSNWDARLIASLNQLGIQSTTISSLEDGQPVVFVGRKGDPEGSAIEIISDGTTLPSINQSLELMQTISGMFSSGKMTSARVGPASNWDYLHYNVKAEDNDNWQVVVSGVDQNGTANELFTSNRLATLGDVDLSGVGVSQYPYLQLDFVFSDSEDQTAPQVDSWGVVYDEVPEGIIAAESIDSETLQEGEIFSRKVYFTNISTMPFTDSLDISIGITNVESSDREDQAYKVVAPLPGDTSIIYVESDTRGKVGQNNLSVAVSSSVLENFRSNNSFLLSSAFTVEEDGVNPLLDVTIDGSYILDGDIVSPNPVIRIKLKDENEYLLKDDTVGVTIEMKRACDECVFERVNLSSSQVSYTLETEDNDFEVVYSPSTLVDGAYTLRVQAADETGNKSGLEPYEVSFEVINESSITYFYPYPNPFSTSTRFVFTLTGSVIPEQIKIQIMTISGRVVREITQDEIGPIKIGNNITQYAWDGRDEYGDRLANGVYLYKVFVKQDGQTLDHRVTSAERGFKNGFGKLYILR